MTTQTLQTAPMTAASSPRVNLMPPEIAEAARFRQIQVMLGVVLIAALAIVGLLYMNAHSAVSGAQNGLDASRAQNASLQTKLAQLASVQQTLNEVQEKQGLLATAMGTEVRWSFLMNDLALRMPSDVWLTSMDVEETAVSNAAPAATGAATLGAATTPAPAVAFPIGTVTFAGVGFSHDDVAKWLDAMTKVKGFLDPTFTNSQEAQIGLKGIVNFEGTVGMISDLFSNRYIAAAGSAAPGAPAATTPTTTAGTGTSSIDVVPGTGIAAP